MTDAVKMTIDEWLAASAASPPKPPSRTNNVRPGAAARAFVIAKSEKKPKTEQEDLEIIATFVHMNVKTGFMSQATYILQVLLKNGAEATAEILRKQL